MTEYIRVATGKTRDQQGRAEHIWVTIDLSTCVLQWYPIGVWFSWWKKTISMSDWALNAILCLKERQIDKLVIPLKLGEKNVTVLGSFRLTCP